MTTYTGPCKHGQNPRQCDRCDDEKTIRELERNLDRLRVDCADLAAENAYLRATLNVPVSEPCSMCKGSGKRLVSSFSDPSKQIEKSCSVCKGSGKLARYEEPKIPDPLGDAETNQIVMRNARIAVLEKNEITLKNLLGACRCHIDNTSFDEEGDLTREVDSVLGLTKGNHGLV